MLRFFSEFFFLSLPQFLSDALRYETTWQQAAFRVDTKCIGALRRIESKYVKEHEGQRLYAHGTGRKPNRRPLGEHTELLGEFKGEQVRCTRISRGNVRESTRGNAHERRGVMSKQTHCAVSQTRKAQRIL